MINVNLLPWRAKLRQQKKALFKSTIIAESIIALIIVVIYIFFFSGSAQTYKNQQKIISQETVLLNQKITKISTESNKKDVILAKLSGLIALQKQQKKVVKILNMLSTVTPLMIRINRLTIDKNEIAIVADSPNNELTNELINSINSTNNFFDASLKGSKITEIDGVRIIRFRITFFYGKKPKKVDKKSTK